MEHTFQNDLNGVYEYLSHLSSSSENTTNVFLDTCNKVFQETLVFYDQSTEAKKALHTVLFRAWRHGKESKENFAVSSYSRTINGYEYLACLGHFVLFEHLFPTLYALAPESALEALQELLPVAGEWQQQLMPVYLHICLSHQHRTMSSQILDVWNNPQFKLNDKEVLSQILSMLRIELKNLLPLRQSSTLNPLFIHTQEGMDLNRLNILSTVALSLLSQDDSELPTTKDQTNEAFIIQLVAAIDIYLKKLVLSSIYTSQDTSKRKMVTSTNKDVKKQRIPVDRSMENSSSPVVLIDHWRETVQSMNLSSNDTHKHTFILLCQSLRDQCPPSLTNVPNEHASAGLGRIDDDTQHIGWTEKIYTSLIHRLNTKLPSPSKLDTSLLDCKMWCLYVLHNQSGGWKSVLKVMIQFCDLWTSEMTDPSYMKVFSVMISKENLVVELYHRLCKFIELHTLYGSMHANISMIKGFCGLLYKSLYAISSLQDLLAFQEQVLCVQKKKESIKQPTFLRLDLWSINFELELTKTTNKIVLTQENDQENNHLLQNTSLETMVSEELIRSLTVLSILWPYRVIEELVVLCFQNKKIYLAIVPLLRKLKYLCLFKAEPSSEALLLSVLKDILYSDDFSRKSYNLGNIVTFVRSCCQDPSNTSVPPFLLSCKTLKNTTDIILNAKDLSENCLLDSLNSFNIQEKHSTKTASVASLQLTLTLLNALVDIENTHSLEWLDLFKSMLSLKTLEIETLAVLQCKPFDFAHSLSYWMDKRNTMHPFPAGIRVQEWDMVSSYFKRFGDILKQTFEWISSQSIDIESHSQSKEPFSQTFKRDAQQFFQEIHIYDWKTQLQWYDVYKEAIHLLGLSSPQIKIPNSVYILTGAMNGLFSMDTFEDNEYSACEVNAWALLLNAVKLSKTLLDNIFMYKESWKQNIAVLWKHPNVSTLVIECLYRVIHPTVSLTLHKEYERLLVDFIQQLFYSFDSLSLIREYNYPIPEMSHYVVLLTEKDCKLFFSILYAVRLIHYQGSSSISENEKNTTNKASNELYYVTGIIKTLQNIADWSVLSSSSHRLSGKNSLSLGRIREILDDNTILKMNKVEYSDLNSYIPSELTEAQETTFQEDIVSNIYYPFWDADKRSARSLSLMTLLALCHASQSIENPESHEVIRIFLLQIVDVLRENEFKQEFYRVAEGQVRNRIEKWRKMKTFKRCLIPRPILTLEEEGFVKPYIDQLPNRKHAYVIMKALEIIDKPIPNKNRKSQAIYLTP